MGSQIKSANGCGHVFVLMIIVVLLMCV